MNHNARGWTRSSMAFASLVVWVTSGIALTSCDGNRDVVEAPVVAGTDSPDRDLAEFLNGMVQDARSLPASGLMRGRLAMAYENNLFMDEALISYAQAAALDPEDFRWPYFSALLKGRHGLYQAALDDLERAMENRHARLRRRPWRLVPRHLGAGSLDSPASEAHVPLWRRAPQLAIGAASKGSRPLGRGRRA